MRRFLLCLSLAASAALCQTSTTPPADPDPFEAVTDALRNGQSPVAISLLTGMIEKDPKASHARNLLAGIYIDQNKVNEASDVVQAGIAVDPESAPIQQALGDVEFRKGHIQQAQAAYLKASRLDPKSARAVFGLGRVAAILSLHKSASNLFRVAHNLDPHDNEIVGRYTAFAATNQDQANTLQQYLESLDKEGKRRYQSLVARMELRKFLAGRKTWVLASPYESSKIDLHAVSLGPQHPVYGISVTVGINGARSENLQLDTGASGILISRGMAERAKVERIVDMNVGGIGDKDDPTGYLAFAKSIRVGKVELQNCIVHVSDKKLLQDTSGLIGPDVFERFMITLDFVYAKMLLDPLPGPAWDGEEAVDHYRGPELKGFSPVLRDGGHLLVPTRIEEGPFRLFLLDTGSSFTMISKSAAGDITKVHRDRDTTIKGLSGNVDKVYSADKVVLVFAGFKQDNRDVITFDLSGISHNEGVEISGIMGWPLLSLFRLHLDYRDGVVKFEYKENGR